MVVTSARYTPDGTRLTLARAFERRGAVWSDTLLLDRAALVDRLRARRRVAVGRPTDLPGDFAIENRLTLHPEGWIVADGASGGRDDLGVPLF